MLFNSYDFLALFMPLALIAFYTTNLLRPTLNTLVVFLLSLLFYAYWSPVFTFLLIGSIFLNYLVGQHIKGRHLLFAGIFFNLLILFWFKYIIFVARIAFNEEFVDSTFGIIILPLGISFFTFQQISYLVDRYRGGVVRPNFWTYGAYVTFFPQLIAGPIVRYHDVDRQLQRILRGIPWRRLMVLGLSGMALFMIGLFKKVVIADGLANWSDPIFSAGERPLHTAEVWLGTLAYTFQLYFDFSGYSDMALGIGRMFGLFLPANFYSPYKSRSIAEFWRRWHMSLSFFVRDYVYIPLGGSRKSLGRTAANLILAFTLIGIWHGAGFTFVLWGLYHGALVTLSHMARAYRWFSKMPAAAKTGITFLLVHFGWVMFRAPSVEAAFKLYQDMIIPRLNYGGTVYHVYAEFSFGCVFVGLAALLAFFGPNALELLGSPSHNRFLGDHWPTKRRFSRSGMRRLALPIITGALGFFAVSSIMGLNSTFLYFNF